MGALNPGVLVCHEAVRALSMGTGSVGPLN